MPGAERATSVAAGRKAAAVFDVDGTLVDSTYFHTLAWWQAFRQAGYDIPMAAIHRSVGMSGDKILAHLLPAARDKSGDEAIRAAHAAVFATFWPALRPLDGAKELLARCFGSGLAVALASSARERDLEVLRSVLDADAYIHAATCAKDAARGKPEPDIIVAALEALGVEARNVVYVGDAVWDVYAAAELGIPTVGLSCGGTGEAELRAAGAVEVYETPRALLDRFRDSAIGGLAARVRG